MRRAGITEKDHGPTRLIADDANVEGQLTEKRLIRDCVHGLETSRGYCKTHCAAGDAEHEAFRENLSHDASARRAKSRAQGQLAASRD
jgi:hypothetical protein